MWVTVIHFNIRYHLISTSSYERSAQGFTSNRVDHKVFNWDWKLNIGKIYATTITKQNSDGHMRQKTWCSPLFSRVSDHMLWRTVIVHNPPNMSMLQSYSYTTSVQVYCSVRMNRKLNISHFQWMLYSCTSTSAYTLWIDFCVLNETNIDLLWLTLLKLLMVLMHNKKSV